jgi:hypothetical protein
MKPLVFDAMALAAGAVSVITSRAGAVSDGRTYHDYQRSHQSKPNFVTRND